MLSTWLGEMCSRHASPTTLARPPFRGRDGVAYVRKRPFRVRHWFISLTSGTWVVRNRPPSRRYGLYTANLGDYALRGSHGFAVKCRNGRRWGYRNYFVRPVHIESPFGSAKGRGERVIWSSFSRKKCVCNVQNLMRPSLKIPYLLRPVICFYSETTGVTKIGWFGKSFLWLVIVSVYLVLY